MSCSACHIDLRSSTFIVCAECTTPSIRLCVLCFMGKYGSDVHAPAHEYLVIPGTKLERSFFEHIELGNVMSLIDTTRRFSVGSWEETSRRSRIEAVSDNENILFSLNRMWRDSGIGEQTRNNSLKDSPSWEILQAMIIRSTQEPVGSDMSAFIDRRCDFDFEYDDSAELIIADLELSEDDLADERLAKIDCLRQLTSRLLRREVMKKFVRDNRLLKIQNQMDTMRAKTAEELEVYGKARPLRRYFDGSGEADVFYQMMLYERRLRAQIRTLEKTPAIVDSVDEKIDPISFDSTDAEISGQVGAVECEDRLVTRHRAQQELRRAKLTESEIAKVTDFTEPLRTTEAVWSEVNPEELEILQRLELSQSQFVLMKGAILKRFQDSRVSNLSISLMKIGKTLFVEGYSNTGDQQA